MSDLTSNSIFQKFCSISQQVQHVQSLIEQEEINPSTRIQYHKALETLQDDFEALKEKASSTELHAKSMLAQFKELGSQIITLYRKIEEGFEKYEISLISKEAIDLSQSLATGKMLGIAKKIDALKHNVQHFYKHRRPSLKNRKIIHLALKLTNHIDEAVQSRGIISKEHLQFIQRLKMLLKEAIFQAEEVIDPSEAELMMELYEIADLMHYKKEKEGLAWLNLIRSRLTPAQNARLQEAENDPQELAKILLEIASGNPCMEWTAKAENIIPLIQPA